MLITGDHCKLLLGEFNTSIDWAVSILKQYEPDPLEQVVHMDAFDRRDNRISDLKVLVAYMLDGMMHPEYELHRDRFFAVAAQYEEFDSTFGIKMPEWMWNPDVRSQNYEKFRGLSNKDKQRDNVRSALVAARIRSAARKIKLDLNSITIPLPRGGSRPLNFPIHDHADLVQRWRDADKAKSSAYRNRVVRPAQAAQKALVEASRDLTKEAMTESYAEQGRQLVMARADAARWKDLYEAVKTSDEIAKISQQHTTEINNLTERYEAMLAEAILVVEEANASRDAAFKKLHVVAKTHALGRPVGYSAAVITPDMVTQKRVHWKTRWTRTASHRRHRPFLNDFTDKCRGDSTNNNPITGTGQAAVHQSPDRSRSHASH